MKILEILSNHSFDVVWMQEKGEI